jgi:glycosyltransferase involved in cell wall biosynthesis
MTEVSVIIATYNRSDLLSKALKSILNQEINESFNFEIVIIDNNSTDETRPIVERVAHTAKVPVKYFFESKQGKGFALNRGIKEAQGEILVFTDDDIVADPKWLSNLVFCFEQYNCDSVGGRVLPDYPENTPSWIIDNAQNLSGPIVRYDYGKDIKPYRRKLMYEFLGANFAFKKSVFDDLGLFLTDIGPGHTLMGEDTDMISRLLQANKILYYCGTALVWHPVDPKRMTLGYIAKWNMCLGFYRVIADEKSMPSDLKHIGGYPSYLIKVMVKEILELCFYAFNRKEFLRVWIELFTNIGKAKQIKKFHSKIAKGVPRNELFRQRDYMHV